MRFIAIVGACACVFALACILATLRDVYEDWRNGWPRWRSGK